MDKDTLDSYFYALARVIENIYQRENLGDTLQFICSLATELTNAKGSSIRVYEHGTFELKVLTSYGLSDEYLNSRAMDFRKSIMEIENDDIIIINDFHNDPRIRNPNALDEEGLKSLIGIPFSVNQTIHHLLRVYFKTQKVPTQEEMEMLTCLGQLACIAIQRAAVASANKSI